VIRNAAEIEWFVASETSHTSKIHLKIFFANFLSHQQQFVEFFLIRIGKNFFLKFLYSHRDPKIAIEI